VKGSREKALRFPDWEGYTNDTVLQVTCRGVSEEEGLGSAAGVERALERVMRDEDILVGRKRGCKARLFWKKT
jgi:hypothetical protein